MFTINVRDTQNNDEVFCQISMPVIPRVGEIVWLNGSDEMITVDRVEYTQLPENEGGTWEFDLYADMTPLEEKMRKAVS